MKAYVSLCTWELNFGQTIWDKIKVLLGTPSGITWELGESQGNMMRTRKNFLKLLLPIPQREKTGSIMSACWAFPLVARNFYFQNCFSPFLAWVKWQWQNFGDVFS
jgi:hypothetical protein